MDTTMTNMTTENTGLTTKTNNHDFMKGFGVGVMATTFTVAIIKGVKAVRGIRRLKKSAAEAGVSPEDIEELLDGIVEDQTDDE